MLPNSFDYIFVHQTQKVRLRPEIFANFRPEPPEKPGSTYNSASNNQKRCENCYRCEKQNVKRHVVISTIKNKKSALVSNEKRNILMPLSHFGDSKANQFAAQSP